MKQLSHREKERTRWKLSMVACTFGGAWGLFGGAFLRWQLSQPPMEFGVFDSGDGPMGLAGYMRKVALGFAGVGLAFLTVALYFRRKMREWDDGLLPEEMTAPGCHEKNGLGQ